MITPNDRSATSILIVGVHLKSEAYPNVLHRIRSLIEYPSIFVDEINYPMWSASSPNDRGYLGVLRHPLRFVLSHLLVYTKFAFCRNKKRVYIPYPSVFVQNLISFLPSRLKPECSIIDATISLFDTVAFDRKLLKQENLLAKWLFLLERRAFNIADYVIVDTDSNVDYLSSLYGLPAGKFISIPLATNETIFRPKPYAGNTQQPIQVVFVGTMIPLHGIDTIISAVGLLNAYTEISFHIIGDGQDARYVREYASKNPANFKWTKQWQSAETLASFISEADICLGIFGSTEKTQRVCPYKIYHYSSVGRPIITAETESIGSLVKGERDTPFSIVDPDNPRQLSNRILFLARSPELRLSLAKKSRDFYSRHLSVSKSTEMLVKLLQGQTN